MLLCCARSATPRPALPRDLPNPTHPTSPHAHTRRTKTPDSERPYTFCSGACKSIIDPGAEANFQVHEFVRDRSYAVATQPAPRACAHLLHFHRLFAPRAPKFLAGAPVRLPTANISAPLVKTC